MMGRSVLKPLLIAFLLISGPLWAQTPSVQDQIISQLQNQGFTKIELSRTLLGRVQLRAVSPTLDREMIFNPATGEILRDSWTRRSSGAAMPRVAQPFGRDRDDRDDDRRTDRSDDRDDDRGRSRSADRDDDDDGGKGRGRGRGRGRGGDDDDD